MSQPSDAIRVALTFDAEHPSRPHCSPGAHEQVLDHLALAGVRASFFVQGRWAKAYPDTARRMVSEGHLIGNHSHYHARMTLLSDDGIRTDVAAAEDAIAQITGTSPRPWFRCPFGDGSDDQRVLDALEGLGYRDVFWDVDPEDWNQERTTPDVVSAVLEGIAAHGDGAVVLFHTWPATTAEALPVVLRSLEDQGTRFALLHELALGTRPTRS